ncbi:MAG TPA: HEAT repeat domain-containing protein [Planctomycetota bacterium]|nr:HEAT repeat domain-containing protein [Planctomycetota bacterium]
MYRSLAEAAANCTRNIATGYGPVFSDRKQLGVAAVLTRGQPEGKDIAVAEGHAMQPTERIPVLIQALKQDDCSMRVSAVCDLARMGPLSKDAVPALIEALDDGDWVVRVAAITALGEIGADAKEAVPSLIDALDKEDVCTSAAIALGRMGTAATEAVEKLTQLRNTKTGFLRWCAEEALRSIQQR